MQVRVLQCVGVVLKGFKKPSGIACAGVLVILAGACAAQTVSSVVTPAAQATRDDERLRILRDELRKAEALIESLGKRKAERLAAADTAGADEAEENRIRALSDIAGLKREIAGTRPRFEAPRPTLSTSSASTASTKPAPQPTPQPPAPWWDVYGKARRGETSASSPRPAPVSYAQPATAGARFLPAQRTE